MRLARGSSRSTCSSRLSLVKRATRPLWVATTNLRSESGATGAAVRSSWGTVAKFQWPIGNQHAPNECVLRASDVAAAAHKVSCWKGTLLRSLPCYCYTAMRWAGRGMSTPLPQSPPPFQRCPLYEATGQVPLRCILNMRLLTKNLILYVHAKHLKSVRLLVFPRGPPAAKAHR